MKRQAGFTLIELLVAMGIAALIAVLAYQAVEQVVQLKAQAEVSAQALRAQQRALWKMEQDVLQMAPQGIRGPYGDPQPAMVLDAQGWRFSRVQRGLSPQGVRGIVRVGYRLQGDTLVREIWPVLNPDQDGQPHVQHLLAGVQRFEVWLWPSAEAAPQRDWPPLDEEGVPRMTALPVAVRVRLQLKNGVVLERWWVGVS